MTHRLAVHQNLAVRRVVEAKDDVHQGRFARTVFAKQRQDLALHGAEVDILIGDDAREKSW
jgi:hypothetical protein